MRPRLLDLYCGAGGAARGYQEAGFYVVGVDHKAQPRYAGDAFVHVDALFALNKLTDNWYIKDENGERWWLDDFDAIHASPPCQRWAQGFVKNREKHPDLIELTRRLLKLSGLPYVIENVPAAPLRDAVTICGGALGCMGPELQIHRHRRFESNVGILGATCTRQRRLTVSVVGNGTPSGNRITIGRNPTIAEKREVMGIEWMTRAELSEAIPPAYTRYIGAQLLAHLRGTP